MKEYKTKLSSYRSLIFATTFAENKEDAVQKSKEEFARELSYTCFNPILTVIEVNKS